MDFFKNLEDYGEYLKKHPFHKDLNIEIDSYSELNEKKIHESKVKLEPANNVPLAAELDDLIRLHYLITSRKVTTILEFGVGKSSIIFDHALEHNKLMYADFVLNNLRRSNPFECHSVDNNLKWINATKKTYPLTKNITFHYSSCNLSTFNDRICTLYDSLPNICPDFIYLDAPDQFSPNGIIRGISTNHPDRLPMSADILTIEHFLLPGTLIVVDGRTGNARFLKANLQRKWSYIYFEKFDQHLFELSESPVGIYNKKQLEFCLNKS